MQLPSASNSAGTFLGSIAGAAIIASAPSWPFVITMAAALGMTPVGAASELALGVASIVNLVVTHIAEAKSFNDKAAMWWPILRTVTNIKTFPDYKGTGNDPLPKVTTNLQTKDGGHVE